MFLQCANGRGRSGGQTAGAHPKSFPRPRQPLFFSAGIERARKVLAGLAFCEMLSQYPQSAFKHSLASPGGGQQQFAAQTLRVHLLGLECLSSLPKKRDLLNAKGNGRRMATQLEGVLRCKWKACWNTNGRSTEEFPFLGNSVARKLCNNNWGRIGLLNAKWIY